MDGFTYYGLFDADGLAKGYYNTDVYPDTITLSERPDDLPDDQPFEPVEIRSRNPAIPAEAVEITQAQWHELISDMTTKRWDVATGSVKTIDPPPAPPQIFTVAKIDVLRQLSDDDYARLDAKVKEQTPRIQAIYNTAINFVSDSPEYGLLYQMATELFGPDRAKQLLGQGASS